MRGNSEALFGAGPGSNTAASLHWGGLIHPDDQELVQESLADALGTSVLQWQQAYRFIRSDGSEARILDKASIFRDASEKAHKMMKGVMQDLAKQQTTDATVGNKSEGRRNNLVKKIKDLIIQLVNHSDQQDQLNYLYTE